MIKKFLLLSLVISGVFADSFNDNVKKLIEGQTGTDIKIIKDVTLKDNKNLKFIIVEIVQNAQRIPMFASKDGKTIIGLSNIFFTSSKADEDMIKKVTEEAMSHNENSQKTAAGNLIGALTPDEYIPLKSKAKNPGTYFIVADPNCGYCKEELKHLDDRLKTHNVNMVVVGMLGEDSQKKAAYLMSKISNEKSQKDKIKLLEKVFSSNFKAPKTIDTSSVKKTTEALFKTGVIQGVPYIYEHKKAL